MNITHAYAHGLPHSHAGEVLASYNDDDIYLFNPPGTRTCSASGPGGGQHTGTAPGTSAAATGRALSRRTRPARAAAEGVDGIRDALVGGGNKHRSREGRGPLSRGSGRATRRQRRSGSSACEGGGNRASADAESSEDDSSAVEDEHDAEEDGSDDGMDDNEAGASGRVEQAGEASDHVVRRYSGHRNNMTVKGVAFMGRQKRINE